MILHPTPIGIDVSKASLDIFDSRDGRTLRIANAAEPLAEIAAAWREAGAFILFEATGRYDALLRVTLAAAGIAHARVNPGRARDFAKAAGFLAKTDRIDARMLAAMATALRPAAEPAPDADRERLSSLHRRRDQPVAMRQKERTRRSEAAEGFERDTLDRHIAWLSAEIATFDTLIAQLVGAAPALKTLWQRLVSAPGIGPVTAVTLIALLPELGARSPKTIAALAGLAPLNHDSGQFRGQRSIHGGRKRVRDALYMAALAAARSKSRFGALYTAMRLAGKAPKLALIAIARKLLVTLNAMIRDNIAFQP